MDKNDAPRLGIEHIVHLWMAQVPAKLDSFWTDGDYLYIDDLVIAARTNFVTEIIWVYRPKDNSRLLLVERAEEIVTEWYGNIRVAYSSDVMASCEKAEDKFWGYVEKGTSVILI